ncbi:hypothetical protein F5X68DRAFT_208113 [Plectosphaerella plurivora]|uniref:Uncharacterized protein n=1 Tax=Plectosphaerella plurivora TaxID=936078 RepID=A0A9P8VC65_9PEZI|nr:hypothetical protein F5X68DRAFT_208113 [Plectosphaerella plurivora]
MRRLLLARPYGALPGSLPRGARALTATLAAQHRTHILRHTSCISSQAHPAFTREAPAPAARPTPRRAINLSLPTDHLNVALSVYHGVALEPGSKDLQLVTKLAKLDDTRPSVVTAQMIMFISPNLPPDLLGILQDNQGWDRKLTKVVDQKYSKDEVFVWARLLTAKTSDDQVKAYINHAGPKPLFLLNYLLRKEAHRNKGMSAQSLEFLIEYCEKNPNDVLRTPRDADPNNYSSGAVSLNPAPIEEVLGRFLGLARRIRPKAVVKVADFVAACLEKLTPTSASPDAVYRFKCRIFTSVLRRLAIPPRRSAYKHRRHSWEGILRLLSLSSGLEKPFVIDRASYRAIRSVLLGVPKADAERDSATALSGTWPPYRILRDGMEEETPLEEFASRAVKAGTMMVEAGYAKELSDLVIDVLGGSNIDGTPTIQTRSIISQRRMDSMSPSDLWAAQVRATRNPEEAWQVFQRPPLPDMRPDAVVYQQMFYKLLARHAEDHHRNLPGDGRETFPFDDLNYSDFEKARLTPPTLDQLMSAMDQDGIPLEGEALRGLLRHVPTIHLALECINQSSLPLPQQMALENLLRAGRFQESPEYMRRYHNVIPTDIRRMPKDLVQVAVELLCRLHPNLTSAGLEAVRHSQLGRIHRARRVAQSLAHRGHPRLWEIILEATSRPNILLAADMTDRSGKNVLLFSGKTLAIAQHSCNITPSMFMSFSRVVRKTMESIVSSLVESIGSGNNQPLMTFSPAYNHPTAASSRPLLADWPDYSRQVRLVHLLDSAQGAVKAMWQILSEVRASDGKPDDAMVNGVIINNYMCVLAFVGDHGEMEQLLRWTLEHIATVEDGSDIKGLTQLGRALCAFRAFAEPMLPEETVDTLRHEFEDPRGKIRRALDIQWPSDEEVSRYAESDHWGNRQQLILLLQEVRNLRRHGGNDGGEGGARREREQETSAKAWEPHEQLKKHLSRFERELVENWGFPGLALYNKSKELVGW